MQLDSLHIRVDWGILFDAIINQLLLGCVLLSCLMISGLKWYNNTRYGHNGYVSLAAKVGPRGMKMLVAQYSNNIP